MTSKPWYSDGLRFSCTRCGNCCTGPPGYVWFSDEEAVSIADYLETDVGTFRRRHAKKINGHWSLKETLQSGKYDCVFLTRDDQGRAGCSIYPVRPLQCRTWPFWPENLAGPSAWRRTAQTCPGLDQGRLYPLEQIRVIRDSHDAP